MRADKLFRWTVQGFGILIVIGLSAVAFQMVVSSTDALRKFGFGFVVGTSWDPVREKFGGLPFLYGTIVSSVLSLLLAVPVSIGIAVFLTELAPRRLRAPLGLGIELLAAVPSVIYGLWGIFALAPWLRGTIEPALGHVFGFLPFFRGTPRGIDLLAGALILSIMILPTITSVTREVIQTVPGALKEGALALGATRWEMIWNVVLPYARSGIAGAVILGLGRALGETMAATMVIGNRPVISASMFEPAYTMAAVIANEFTEAVGDVHLAALAEMGLLLFVVTVILNVAARLLIWRIGRLPGGAARA